MVRRCIVVLSTLMWFSSIGFALPIPDANEELIQVDAMLEKELKLSQEQQQQLQLLKQQLQGRRNSLQTQLKVVNAQINQQIQNTLRNDQKLGALLAQKKQLLEIMVKNNNVYKQQYYNMLSPNQKVKFTQRTQKINTSKNTPATPKKP